MWGTPFNPSSQRPICPKETAVRASFYDALSPMHPPRRSRPTLVHFLQRHRAAKGRHSMTPSPLRHSHHNCINTPYRNKTIDAPTITTAPTTIQPIAAMIGNAGIFPPRYFVFALNIITQLVAPITHPKRSTRITGGTIFLLSLHLARKRLL